MNTSTSNPKTIDEYINSFPKEVRDKLQVIRQIIREEAPEAKETIKYRMPTFTWRGNLVHFAAFKHHIGLYPTSSPIEAFKNDLMSYKTSKGAIQFPMVQSLPYSLIRKIVQFRVKQKLDE